MPDDERPAYPVDLYPGCPCYACDSKTWWKPWPGSTVVFAQRMSLCPTCGNKRCPGAANHANPCSGSNEPGQQGSRYPAVDAALAARNRAAIQAYLDGGPAPDFLRPDEPGSLS